MGGRTLFYVNKPVSGQQMVRMSGDYLTRVFEGPFKNAPKWKKEMAAFVISKGKQVKKNYFFYTTGPRGAKIYGKNYMVTVAEIA